MQTQFAFFASIAFSLIAWGMVAARYMWPELRIRQRAGIRRPAIRVCVRWPGGYESLFPIFSLRAKTPGRLGVRLEVK